MWHSEEDFLRDIASLSSFEAPEDKESCKVLYSVGRGLKVKEKPKPVEKFIDPRSGEVINLENDFTNTCYTSKGRGSVLGSLFRTHLQLQQQLRLARPLGSGDGVIESYYGRSRSTENVESSTETSDFVSLAQNPITSDEEKEKLNSNKIRKRVKGTRNSGLTSNALINSLLSKNQAEANMLENDVKHEQQRSNPNKNENFDKIGSTRKCSPNNLDFSSLTLSSKPNKKIDSVEKNLGNLKESTNKVLHGRYFRENFKVIDDDNEKEEKLKKETKRKNKNIEDFKFNANGFNSTELESDRDLKYKALGERLNRLRQIPSNRPGRGRYDFTPFSTSTKPYNFAEEDFPPLKKS